MIFPIVIPRQRQTSQCQLIRIILDDEEQFVKNNFLMISSMNSSIGSVSCCWILGQIVELQYKEVFVFLQGSKRDREKSHGLFLGTNPLV
jgi:hypothetical protein